MTNTHPGGEAPPENSVEHAAQVDQTAEEPPAAPTLEVSQPAKPSRGLLSRAGQIYGAHRLLILGIVAGVVLLAVGAGWILTSSAQRSVSDSLRAQLNSAHSTIRIKQSEIDAYASQQAAMQQAQDKLKADQSQLAQDQATLKAGQAALVAQTQLVQASQFEDGQYVVGQTLAPGVYRETAGGSCYYEWASSTAADATIVNNDIPQGPAQVTLRPGDIFTSSRCGTWTKIG